MSVEKMVEIGTSVILTREAGTLSHHRVIGGDKRAVSKVQQVLATIQVRGHFAVWRERESAGISKVGQLVTI